MKTLIRILLAAAAITTAILAWRWLWQINLHKKIELISLEPPSPVAKIARKTMVSIQGEKNNLGSGFIVSKNGNNYYVLTTKQVVSHINKYHLRTHDGANYTIEAEDYHSKIRPISNLDLAVVEFVSKNQYTVPELGDSSDLAPETKIYLAGFPEGTKPTPLLRFTEGKLIDRVSPNGLLQEDDSLIYTNPTLPGMVGGQLLDQQGRLVGIHSTAELECGSKKCPPTGLNFGIPIATFLRQNYQIFDLRINTATRTAWIEDSFRSLYPNLKVFNSKGEINCHGSTEVSYRSQQLKSPDSKTKVYFEAMLKRYGCKAAKTRRMKMAIEQDERVKFQHFPATDNYNFSNPLSYSADGRYLIVAQNWSSGTERWNTFLFVDTANNYNALDIQSCQGAQFGGRFRGFKSSEDAVFECLDPESYWEIVNLRSKKIQKLPKLDELAPLDYPSYGSIGKRSQILQVEDLPRYYAFAE